MPCSPATPPGSGVASTLYALVTAAPGPCACLLGANAEIDWSDDLGYWFGEMVDQCDETKTWNVRMHWVVNNTYTLQLSRSDGCFGVNVQTDATLSPFHAVFEQTNIPDKCCETGAGTTRENVVVTISETPPPPPPVPPHHPTPHVHDTDTIQRHCITAAASTEDGESNSDCSAAPVQWVAYAPTSELGTGQSELGMPGGGMELGLPLDPPLAMSAIDDAATCATIPAGAETCFKFFGAGGFSGLEDTDRALQHLTAYIALYATTPDVHVSGLYLATLTGGTLTLIGDDQSATVQSDLTGAWVELSLDPATPWGLTAVPETDPTAMQAAIDALQNPDLGIAIKFENAGTDTAMIVMDYGEQGACVQRTFPACHFADSDDSGGQQTQPAADADGASMCDCSTTPWSNAGNITSETRDEALSASAALQSDEESCHHLSNHHDFTIPNLDSNCAVASVTVRMVLKASEADSIVCELAQLTDGATLLGDDQSASAFDEAIPIDWTEYIIGFDVPLWGLTAEDLAAVVNEVGFGVATRFKNNGANPATIFINFIEICVCYACE